MAEPVTLGRRAFLLAGIALGGGGLLLLTRTGGGPDAGGAPIALELAELLGASRPVRELGRAYLERFPDERDVDRLASEIFAGAPGAAPDERAAILAGYRRRVAEDFDRGRVVPIRGWLLARTELRLCALVSLL